MGGATDMTPAARALLGAGHFTLLATSNSDGSPQQTPLWYALDRESILMNTTSRTKYRNLLRDPRASMCVMDSYRAVTISRAVQLDDEQARPPNRYSAGGDTLSGPKKGRAALPRELLVLRCRTQQAPIWYLPPTVTRTADGVAADAWEEH
jgi:hypothetical protein